MFTEKKSMMKMAIVSMTTLSGAKVKTGFSSFPFNSFTLPHTFQIAMFLPS